ncbi:glycosyltransferase [Candidatus Pacearchaeota archaeon]|nr:glycosyltransferase [Candidatus Pacearchaeota archaeon]
MKAAIFLATYNKNNQFANTLYSISRQKVDFPIEICIIDDYSDIDPKPIIDELITNFPVKYKRLDKRVGTQFSHGKCFGLASDDIDIIILSACDVIYVTDNIVSDLAYNTFDSKPSIAEVVDIPIEDDFYTDFDNNTKDILDNWEQFDTEIDILFGNVVFNKQKTVYSGRSGQDPYFFLGAMTIHDFIELGFTMNACDVIIKEKMKELNYEVNLMSDLKGIHQRHLKIPYGCNVLKNCKSHCVRKLDIWKQNWK